jgi:hypothetical protein
MKPKTSAAGPHSDLDKFVDDLDDLSILASAARTKVESTSSMTLFGVAATFLGLDSFQSKDLRSRYQLDPRNFSTNLQETDISGSLSALEKDLDSLLQLEEPKATTRWGALGCFGTSDLMITSTPERRFVHWEGMKPSDQLEAED